MMSPSGDCSTDDRDFRRLAISVLADPGLLSRLPPGELDLVVRILRRLRLLGYVATNPSVQLEQRTAALPSQASDQLTSARVLAEHRARVARWELDRIAWALDDVPTTVPLIALKGAAYLLAGTPNSLGRLFADIDLMVPEQYLSDVEVSLRQRGWKLAELSAYDDRYYRLWTHELPPLTHLERGVELDLHHNIVMRTGRLKPSAALLVEASRPVEGTRFRVLASIDMVLHAMVHLFSGEFDGALRELVDIDRLVRHYAANDPHFWQDFWPRAIELDLTRPAFYGLRYSHEFLGTPVPAELLSLASPYAPGTAVLAAMDALVPITLLASSPVHRPRGHVWARMLLIVRSHWTRMPPGMLISHLAHKLWARTAGRYGRGRH
jgi:hypothetical protein